MASTRTDVPSRSVWYVLAAACFCFYVYRVRALSFHVATTFVESSSVYIFVLMQIANPAMTTGCSTTQCRTPHLGALMMTNSCRD